MTDDINVTIAEEQSIIVALENGVGQDTKSVKVSSNDTTDNFLQSKLVAGNDITISVDNEGANETLTISTTAQPAGNYFNKTTDTTDDITDTASNRFTNDTDIARLANTSGTNTGDQVLPTRASLGLDITDTVVFANLTGTNTGDVSVVDSSEIDFTLTGQQITASIKSGSIDETKLDASVNASLDLADSAIQTELDPVFTAHPAYSLTSQDLIDIGNLSGINTGDQDLSPFELLSNKSTDTSLGTSDTLYPSQNAVKVYADNVLGSANALVYKGVIDCSTNPNYPAADAGHLYVVSVAGKIGGASGIVVEVGDMCICNTDGTASGDQATVGNKWNIIQKNIVGAVTGPASSVDSHVAFFDGTTGKVIKDSGLTLSGTNTGDITVTDSAEIDFTLTGQALSASIVASSIDETKLSASVNASLDLADGALQINQTTPQIITATDTTITASDEIYFGDATDSFKIKKDTIQGILDLIPSPDLSAYAKIDATNQPFTSPIGVTENSTATTGQLFLRNDGTGDSAIKWGITGDSYIAGIDNSDSDKFKISYSSTAGSARLGTNDRFTMTTAGWIGLGTNAPSAILHTSESESGTYIDTLHGIGADGYRIDYARNDEFGPRFIVLRSRGTASSRTRLLDNDQIFYFDGRALGTIFGKYVAQFSIEADGNHAVGSTPGKIVFKTQPSGSEDLATLVTAFSINSSGTHINDNIKHYIGTAKNASIYSDGTGLKIVTGDVTPSDLVIDCGTEKTLELAESVWDDIQFNISSGKVGLANVPTWGNFTTNTSEYSFDIDDYLDLGANELAHWWKEGTTVYPHIHLALNGANTSGESQYVKFTLYISYADVNEVWNETSIPIEKEIPDGTATLTHLLGNGASLALTNNLIGSQVKIRIKRIAATSGTEYPNEIFVTQVGFHAEKDTMGSRTISAK